jgi:hypothetical protein
MQEAHLESFSVETAGYYTDSGAVRTLPIGVMSAAVVPKTHEKGEAPVWKGLGRGFVLQVQIGVVPGQREAFAQAGA